ncbi:hypothetical protein D7B24_008119 [Verticillium nonalfalfae]|uniref:Acyltransferase 3 domain-containing protein n=1 Tax=Verticillium nonalfalfae TaxID=1051616 RepID=A0A3M9YLH5_9PEZI|nr:uncharacterized protein D7B24_008119 [Verticillium nonalfalfae]RNJ60428.1 hypothetical protein D7B24_008119 [Verticillium nonalfalfae]
MPSSDRDEPSHAQAPDGPESSLPWSTHNRNISNANASLDDHEKPSNAVPGAMRNASDKIRSLDGLRGIACLLVFNYHFLWPWTPLIMLGYGAMPPHSPEPYTSWATLPIVCLLHRGHPMVAIFFAISGYVVCRHILRSIHERRIEAAYQSIASAVFRRVFRLYIPPTISMFIVAMLAQVGVFRSEDAVYKGRDSVYINGTVTMASIPTLKVPCANMTHPVTGADGVAGFLHLQNSLYLGNLTTWTDTICLNVTSKNVGPSTVYRRAPLEELDALNISRAVESLAPFPWVAPYFNPAPIDLTNITNVSEPATWVQLGGSWEEHPFIHDNMTYAIQNFTRAYAEWANPFNFGHYHPRYDPHTFTIPMELRGSMFVYIFLLATAAFKPKARHALAAVLTAYCLQMGRWDMATFLGGTLMSELDIRAADTRLPLSRHAQQHHHLQQSIGSRRAFRWLAVLASLYLLSYPDAAAEYTPGFQYMSTWVPRYYVPLAGWMVYQSLGALLLLWCILRSPLLRRLLESRLPQYLGRVSFSLYLVHGPVLHSLGFWIMPRLFDRFGRAGGYAIGYVVLLSVTLYLTNLWHRKVDVWSIGVGKRVERALVDHHS